MGYISEAKDIKQKRYGAYINHCKTLSIKPVAYTEFTLLREFWYNQLKNTMR